MSPVNGVGPAVDDSSYLRWILGGVAVALFAAVLLFAFNNDRTQTANDMRPTVRETTGSGAASPRANDRSDVTQPALPNPQNNRP